MSLFLRLTLFSCLAVTLSAQAWPEQSGGGVVSVEELRHPLKGDSLSAILTAQKHLQSGQRERGIEELRQAMRDPAAMPYAISMLGAEHLKAGQTDVALPELEWAVEVLPGIPENRSNLALALYVKGETARGLEQVRKAVQLDPRRPKPRMVLGLLLLQQGSHDAEAVYQLKAAAEGAPGAHLALARHYEQVGKTPEAEHERRAYSIVSMGLLAGK